MAHSELTHHRDEQGAEPVEEKKSADPDAIDMGWRSSRRTRTRVVAAVALVAAGVTGYLLGRVTAGPDVSVGGQVSYACAMAEKVRESHPSEDDWGPVGEDRAYSAMFAIPGLLGLSAPQPGKHDFADAGWDSLRDPRGDDPFGQILDATIDECGQR